VACVKTTRWMGNGKGILNDCSVKEARVAACVECRMDDGEKRSGGGLRTKKMLK
jgi:hypothetical protein